MWSINNTANSAYRKIFTNSVDRYISGIYPIMDYACHKWNPLIWMPISIEFWTCWMKKLSFCCRFQICTTIRCRHCRLRLANSIHNNAQSWYDVFCTTILIWWHFNTTMLVSMRYCPRKPNIPFCGRKRTICYLTQTCTIYT